MKGKARQVYVKLWQHFPKQWVREARVECEIGKVQTARDVARVIVWCQKQKYTAYKQSGAEGAVKLVAAADPFVQVADMLQAPKAYKQALYEMDKDFVNNILKELKVNKKAGVRIVKHIAKGDKQTELVVSMK